MVGQKSKAELANFETCVLATPYTDFKMCSSVCVCVCVCVCIKAGAVYIVNHWRPPQISD